MAVRLNKCNKCGSTSLDEIKVINPDTTEMNMDAVLRCEECGYQDTYKVQSNYTKKMRKRGFIR